jgi:hypothetical protein
VVPRWVWCFGSALLLVPIGVAVASSRKQRGGMGDASAKTHRGMPGHKPPPNPFANTAEPDEDEDENPYEAKLPQDVGDCLVLGKDRPNFKFGSYRVCLTPNQKQTLFKKRKGKKLGCGVFACAYSTSAPTKVVKFTRDSEDVAALLEAQKTGVVPKVFATYTLKDGGHSVKTDDHTPVYALVVEKLKTFTPAEREAIDDEIGVVRAMVKAVDSGKVGSIAEACQKVRDEDGYDCGPITQETAEATLKLKQAGIDWNDVHSGNIGLDRNGNIKILDLGITGTQLKEQPKILEGAKRRLLKHSLDDV